MSAPLFGGAHRNPGWRWTITAAPLSGSAALPGLNVPGDPVRLPPKSGQVVGWLVRLPALAGGVRALAG